MNRFGFLRVCALASASLLTAPAFAGSPDDKVLDFDTMAGVVAPYTGATNPIRGVPGGGRPWVLDRAQGTLRADGRLEIRVRGLVLTETRINPVASFRAIVSCMIKDEQGAPSSVNVGTEAFPATPTGDAHIVETVVLPSPCLAPIIFVTSPTGAWFAITGN